MKYMIQNSIISRGKGKKRREQGYDSMCMRVCSVVWCQGYGGKIFYILRSSVPF